eukprot:11573039-Alexandrium_andersonii.AAC.1
MTGDARTGEWPKSQKTPGRSLSKAHAQRWAGAGRLARAAEDAAARPPGGGAVDKMRGWPNVVASLSSGID